MAVKFGIVEKTDKSSFIFGAWSLLIVVLVLVVLSLSFSLIGVLSFSLIGSLTILIYLLRISLVPSLYIISVLIYPFLASLLTHVDIVTLLTSYNPAKYALLAQQ